MPHVFLHWKVKKRKYLISSYLWQQPIRLLKQNSWKTKQQWLRQEWSVKTICRWSLSKCNDFNLNTWRSKNNYSNVFSVCRVNFNPLGNKTMSIALHSFKADRLWKFHFIVFFVIFFFRFMKLETQQDRS